MLGLINGWTSLQANHYKKPPLADCLSYLDANLLDFYFYRMNGIRRCYRWTSRSYVWWWLSPSLIAAMRRREATTEHSAKGPFVTSCLSYNLSVAQTGHAAQLWYIIQKLKILKFGQMFVADLTGLWVTLLRGNSFEGSAVPSTKEDSLKVRYTSLHIKYIHIVMANEGGVNITKNNWFSKQKRWSFSNSCY